MVPLKYLSSFSKTLEMLLINCEINFLLTQSANCFLFACTVANQVLIFRIADAKVDVPFVSLSSQGSARLLEQIKSGFKKRSKWNKY